MAGLVLPAWRAKATEAARRILETGGNAFDAAVAGQAALAVTDFCHNGVGGDALVLVYDAHEKKVFSVNAEPQQVVWGERPQAEPAVG